jgi:hypothetical protein
MPQNFTQIQQAFDSQLQTVMNATTVPGISSIVLYTENEVSNFKMQPDTTSKLMVRATLVPAKTINETLGNLGYVSVNGLYAIDVIGQVNQGYTAVQLLADAVLAAFSRGQNFQLPNGDTITINIASPSPNTNQGAWTMKSLYCRQVVVEWFGYVQP